MGTGRQSSTEEADVFATAAAEEVAAESASFPAPPLSQPHHPVSGVSCGHEALFDEGDAANRCDVCGQIVEEDSGDGPALPGSALYVWTRGDEVRREEPPLCPSCAAALGLSALGRWEIEEEEG
jgi:hypothetical protein